MNRASFLKRTLALAITATVAPTALDEFLNKDQVFPDYPEVIDDSYGRVIDMSEEIAQLEPDVSSLQSLLKEIKNPTYQTNVAWLEKEILPKVSTFDGLYQYARLGDIWRIDATGQLIRITSIDYPKRTVMVEDVLGKNIHNQKIQLKDTCVLLSNEYSEEALNALATKTPIGVYNYTEIAREKEQQDISDWLDEQYAYQDPKFRKPVRYIPTKECKSNFAEWDKDVNERA